MGTPLNRHRQLDIRTCPVAQQADHVLFEQPIHFQKNLFYLRQNAAREDMR